ncbi:hypothetical protein GCM10010522_43460 [Kribbella solani]
MASTAPNTATPTVIPASVISSAWCLGVSIPTSLPLSRPIIADERGVIANCRVRWHVVEMPVPLQQALQRYDNGTADRADLKLLTKELLKILVAKAPGHAVEVRVPPYGAVQCIEGPRHTRGTPGAVIELPPELWISVALGRTTWAEARATGKLRASGERTDLSALLPLT